MSSVSNEFEHFQHEKKRNDFLSFAWRFVRLLLRTQIFFSLLTLPLRSVIHNDGAHENLFRFTVHEMVNDSATITVLLLLLFLYTVRCEWHYVLSFRMFIFDGSGSVVAARRLLGASW